MLENEARRLLTEHLVDGNAGARPMSNHLSASEAATKERILASKRQNNASGNVGEDIIQVRGVHLVDLASDDDDEVEVVEAADDDEVEIVEVEKECCVSEDNNANGDSIESGEEEEESVFWKRVGLQMVPVCARKACEVGLKRIPIERGDKRESVGLKSSQRIQQLKMATMNSNSPSIPTCLYNNRRVVVQFVADGLSSFSSPFPPTPLTTPSYSLSSSTSTTLSCLPAIAAKNPDLASSALISASLEQNEPQSYPHSSPCANKKEPTLSSSISKLPMMERNLERLKRKLEFGAEETRECEGKGKHEEKEDTFEKLRWRLEVCAKEIKECEEKEMDWAGGASSRYIKAGKLKKKFIRLYNKLEAHQGSVSVAADKASGYDWMSLYLEEDDADPAESNPNLEAKLNNQLKEGRSKINKLVSDFVEIQERGVVCMDDDDSSIDLEAEEECRSIDDEEEDVDEDESDVDDFEEEEKIDEEGSDSVNLDEEEEDMEVTASEIEDGHCS